ncbi:MAG: DUF3077 domain-containing protein [Pseudomonas sp.]|jgi:hypothetical protein|uniref:DUF6124 family protein n=1 Tax=Pseudomonas sp. TaxID=306 RepID=UPI00238C54F7|nr:DUF3077 domain-containing protein [Pseudomonas sp.]MDP9030375.1 DUF3077 domain-containing protein [Pseudomonadota bacterium]MDE1909340.1 DUF3077 domain-containing protein [Pseudomonas sp.]MDE2033023.1 DUF3077 domain-containing protein [Pseudomonas sp.]MDE2193772.1 DUF3077 domain-containing protein [Pseudomonas sp.]MDE2555865.1 DUF3077 domain-containing protein [Pseudomonas sp.]
MVKVTPDPPTFRKALLSDNDVTRRAIDHYLKAPDAQPSPTPFTVDDELSFEDALAHAAELLHCAVATAQASTEPLNGAQRAVMHLVEMSKVVVDRALDCLQPR